MPIQSRKPNKFLDERDYLTDDPFIREIDKRNKELERRQKPAPEDDETYIAEEFAKGFGAGIDQTQGLIGGGAKAALGSLFGNDEWVAEGLDYYQEQMNEAAENAPAVSWEDDWEGVGDFADFTAYTLGNVLPSIVTTIAGGGVTGAAAKLAAKKMLANKVEQRIEDKFQDAAQDLANTQAQRLARDEYRDMVLERYGKSASGVAKSKLLGQGGAVAGGGLTSATMGTGENFARIYEETGLEDPGAAMALGIAMGALDTIGAPFRAFKKMFPDESMDSLKDYLSEAAIKDRGRIRKMYESVSNPRTRTGSAVKELGIGAAREGITEATQEWLSRTSVLWAKENLPEEQQARFIDYLSNEDAMSSYLHAAVAGVIGGSAIGGTIGAVAGPDQKFDPEREQLRQQVLAQLRKEAMDAYDSVENQVETEPALPTTDPREEETRTPVTETQETAEPTQSVLEQRLNAALDVVNQGDVSVDDVANAMDIAPVEAQELLDTLEEQELISADLDAEGSIYSITDEGAMELFPPPDADEGLIDLPPVTDEEQVIDPQVVQEPEPEPVVEEEPSLAQQVQDNAEILSDMARDGAGWETMGGKGIVDPEGESKGRTPWVARSEWWRDAQKSAPLKKNTEGVATRKAVKKAISGEKLTAAETRHIESMLGSIQDMIDEDQRYQDSIANELSGADPEFSLTEEEYSDSVRAVSEADALKAEEWKNKTEEEKEAELDEIFGKSDGKESDGTDREAETTAAIPDLGQTETDERELASLREGTIQEDDGREGSEDPGELVQPESRTLDENIAILRERVLGIKEQIDGPAPSFFQRVKNLFTKQVDPSDPIVTPEAGAGFNRTKVVFPDTGNDYLIGQYMADAGGGWFNAAPRDNVEINQDLGDTREDAIAALKMADDQKQAFAIDAVGTPKVSRNPENEAQFLISFDNGNTYTVELVRDGDQELWVDAETDSFIGYSREETVKNLTKNEAGYTAPLLMELGDDRPAPTTLRDPENPTASFYNETQGPLGKDENLTVAQRINRINDRTGSTVSIKAGGGKTRMERGFGSASKLMKMLQGIGRQPRDDDRITKLPSVTEYMGYDGSDLDQKDGVAEIAHAILELAERGMPSEFLESSGGIYVRDNLTKGGQYHPSEKSVVVNSKLFDDAIADFQNGKLTRQLIHVLAHEFMHHADYQKNYTFFLKSFEVDGKFDPNNEADIADPQVTFGPIIQELYDLYVSGDEVGLQFTYPFKQYGRLVREARQRVSLDNPQTGGNQTFYEESLAAERDLHTFLQQEVFAQLGALHVDFPAILERKAPKAYRLMEHIFKQPFLTGLEIRRNEDEIINRGAEPDASGVQADIRSRAVDRGGEIPDPGGTGLTGEGGVGQRVSDTGVAGQVQDQDRLDARPPVQEQTQLDIRFEDLPSESQQLTATPTLYGGEPPRPVEGQPTVIKVAREFDNKAAEAYPDRDLSERTDENVEIVSDLITHEALQALDQDGNAGEWYQQKVAAALELAAQKFPELAAGSNDPNPKFAFTAIMAVTSNGATVAENSVNAFRLYEEYRQNNEFTIFGSGKEGPSMRKSFALLNALIEADGIDSVRKFMDEDITVRDLKNNFDLTVSGELQGTVLKGSAILGPKIGGGFYQNLNGNYDPLTMDRWFMRTYGRLTGSLMKEADRTKPYQLNKFRETALRDEYRKKLKKDGIGRVQLRKDDEYLEDYARKVQREYAKGGFKLKNTLNLASNTFVKSQDEKQAPQNGSEREYIRRLMERALEKVNDFNSNNPINMGALQAIIWYPEKQLYKLHGVGNARSEPTDYETEFRKIIEGEESGQGVSGSVGSAQQPRTGRVQRTTRAAERDQDQIDSPEVQEPRQIEFGDEPPAYQQVTANEYSRNQLAREIEDLGLIDGVDGIPLNELTAQDLLVFTKESRDLMRALQRDDWLGFDNVDDLLNTVFDEGLDNYEVSQSTKSALGKYINANFGDTTSGAEIKYLPSDDIAKDLARAFSQGGDQTQAIKQIIDAWAERRAKERGFDSREEMQRHDSNVTDQAAVLLGDGVSLKSLLENMSLPDTYKKLDKSGDPRSNELFEPIPPVIDDAGKVIREGKTSDQLIREFVAYGISNRKFPGLLQYQDQKAEEFRLSSLSDEELSKEINIAFDLETTAEKAQRLGISVVGREEPLQIEIDDEDAPKPRKSRRTTITLESGAAPGSAFNVDDEVRSEAHLADRINEKFTENVVDRYERWQTVEKAMAKALGVPRLPASMSFRDSENLMHSRVSEQLERFEEKHIAAIADLANKFDLSTDQIGMYLLAKHAAERNAETLRKEQERRAAKIVTLERQLEESVSDTQPEGSPSIAEKIETLQNAPFRHQETGSGMTDAEAALVLENAEKAGNKEQYEAIASRVYAMLDEMRQNMVDKGLLDEETRRDWESTYQFYVPLKGFLDQEGVYRASPRAKGFNIKGSESMKAKGRVTLPDNPLFVAFKDAEEKILRAEKNYASQKLLKLVQKFDAPEAWRVFTNRNRPDSKYDPTDPKTLDQMKREMREDDPAMPKYIQVKRGGQTYFIEIFDERLNRQLQDGNVAAFNQANEGIEYGLRVLRQFQNFRRNVIINWNPSWFFVNPIRDVETGLAFLLSEQTTPEGRVSGQKLIGKVMKGWAPSGKAYFDFKRGKQPKNEKQAEIFQYIKDFIEDGAPTGLATTKSLEEIQQSFQRTMPRQIGTDKFNIRIGAPGQAAAIRDNMLDWIEHANQGSENAIRISTYIEARKAGTPRLDAATLAKDLTVNFNRKGEASSAIDSLYLFFNAAIQGNVNIKNAIMAGGSAGKAGMAIATATAARKVAMGMVAFGFMRTIANVMLAGEDDDEEPKYADYNSHLLSSTMAITFADEAYGVPLAYGWGYFDNFGRIVAEQFMDVKTPAEGAVDLYKATAHHFSPRDLHAVNSEDDVIAQGWQAFSGLLPDVALFGTEQAMNVNFFGSPIVLPTPYTDDPASSVGKRGTLESFKWFAQTVNSITGGSMETKGLIDMSPDRLQHMFDFMLGGLGRFGTDAVDTAQKTVIPEGELKESDLPVLRKFAFNPSEYNDQFRYYDNRAEFKREMNRWENSDAEQRTKLVDRKSREYYLTLPNQLKAADRRLRKNRQEIKRLEGLENVDRTRRAEALKKLDEENQLIYDVFNKRYKKALGK